MAMVGLRQPDAFDRALAFALKWEGGFSDDPDDPGGATMKGVTQRVYDAYRDGVKLPHQSVKFISEAEVLGIYHERYWKAAGCDALPEKLAIAVFDTAVNCGVKQALKFLAKTGTAATFLAEREAFYKKLVGQKPRMAKFLKGWLNRVAALRKEIA